MTQIFKQETISTDTFVRLARALEQGAVAVLPTDTVYGMATGAFCEKSIERIYQLKKRPSRQPLQLLIGQVSQVHRVALFSSEAQAAADCFWPGALTLILPPTPAAFARMPRTRHSGAGNAFLAEFTGRDDGSFGLYQCE